MASPKVVVFTDGEPDDVLAWWIVYKLVSTNILLVFTHVTTDEAARLVSAAPPGVRAVVRPGCAKPKYPPGSLDFLAAGEVPLLDDATDLAADVYLLISPIDYMNDPSIIGRLRLAAVAAVYGSFNFRAVRDRMEYAIAAVVATFARTLHIDGYSSLDDNTSATAARSPAMMAAIAAAPALAPFRALRAVWNEHMAAKMAGSTDPREQRIVAAIRADPEQFVAADPVVAAILPQWLDGPLDGFRPVELEINGRFVTPKPTPRSAVFVPRCTAAELYALFEQAVITTCQ
jgi:hypothetical protein